MIAPLIVLGLFVAACLVALSLPSVDVGAWPAGDADSTRGDIEDGDEDT